MGGRNVAAQMHAGSMLPEPMMELAMGRYQHIIPYSIGVQSRVCGATGRMEETDQRDVLKTDQDDISARKAEQQGRGARGDRLSILGPVRAIAYLNQWPGVHLAVRATASVDVRFIRPNEVAADGGSAGIGYTLYSLLCGRRGWCGAPLQACVAAPAVYKATRLRPCLKPSICEAIL